MRLALQVNVPQLSFADVEVGAVDRALVTQPPVRACVNLGPARQGLRHGLRDRASHAGQRRGGGVGQPEIEEAAHVVAVQLHLVDGLGGGGLLHVERAIGGEHDQWQVRQASFDDGRKIVGGGRARSAQKRARAAADAHVAERQKGGRTLVDHRAHAEPCGVLSGPRKRCGARAGADPNVLDARVAQGREQQPRPLADQVRVAGRVRVRRQARRHTGGRLRR